MIALSQANMSKYFNYLQFNRMRYIAFLHTTGEYYKKVSFLQFLIVEKIYK